MNPKKLIPFAAIIVVLALAVVLLRKPAPQNLIVESRQLALIPASARLASAQKIEIISKDKNQLILVKDKEKWQVASLFNAAADGAKLAKLLEALSGALGEVRSNSAEVLADYQLDEPQAATLNIYTDKPAEPAVALLVGKTLNYQSSFVRLKGQNTVYLVNLDLPRELELAAEDFNKAQSNWADKKALSVERTQTVKISLQSPSGKLVLVKETETIAAPKVPAAATGLAAALPPVAPKEVWKIEGKEVALEELHKVLNNLNSFTGTQVLDPAKTQELGLDKPTHLLEVTTDSGEVKSLAAVKDKNKDNNFYYVKTPAANIIYQVPGSVFEQVFQTKQNMLKK